MADLRLDTLAAQHQLGPSSMTAARSTADEANAAKEFESVFLSQAIDQMLRTVDLGGMSGGHAEETWRSFLSQAIADEIAGSGVTRISDGIESAISEYRDATALKGRDND